MDKLEGLAKIAGIIGTAVVARKPIARAAGSLAEALSIRLGTKIAGEASLQSMTLKSAAERFLSRQANIVYQTLEKLGSEQISATFHMQRVHHGVLSHLEKGGFVTADTLETFKSDSTRRRMFAALKDVAGARDAAEARDALLTMEGLQGYLKAAKGVKFTFVDDAGTIDPNFISQLRTFIDSTAVERGSRQIIRDFMTGPSHGVTDTVLQNRRTVVQAIKDAVETEAKRDAAVARFVTHDREGSRILSMREILSPEYTEQVTTYFKTMGVADTEDIPLALRELYEGKKAALFDLGGSIPLIEDKALIQELDDVFMEASSGLSINKKGQIYSLAALRGERENFVANAIEQLKIPLLPFLFEVPAKTFSFMRGTPSLVRGLGNLSAAGELRRAGFLQGIGDAAEGIGIGDVALAIDPESLKITRIGGEGARFLFYETSAGKIGAQARLRAADVEGDWLRNLGRNLRQGDDTVMSEMDKQLFGRQSTFLDIEYRLNQGYVAVPKNPENPIHRLVWSRLYGRGQGVSHMDPETLFNRLVADEGTIADDRAVAEALKHVIEQGAGGVVDISPVLRRLSNESGPVGQFPLVSGLPEVEGHKYYGFLRSLAEASGDPVEIQKVLRASDITSIQFNEIATSQFNEAIQAVLDNPSSLFEVGHSEGGTARRIGVALFGETAPSKAMQKLQLGILSEFTRAAGLDDLIRQTNVGNLESLEMELKALATKVRAGGDYSGNALADHLTNMGFSDGAITTLVDNLVTRQGHVRTRKLGALGVLALDIEALMGRVGSNTANAKILGIIRQDLGLIDTALAGEGGTAINQAFSNNILLQGAKKANIPQVLRERFGGVRGYIPEIGDTDVSSLSRFYITPNSAPTGADWVLDPLGSLKKTWSRKAGINEFIRSAVDPNAPQGQYGMLANILASSPQHLGNVFGAGLPGQDRITPLRSVGGFLLKRVLPLYVGYEFYKNTNENLHAAGLPGIDDAAANTLANINLGMASVKDTFGLTNLNQHIVGALPGLDMYFSPRSREEYEEYLFYGDEGVRESRLWFIGSRQHGLGGRVKYYRPNFYRRWKSHWTEADNVKIADAKYSFLPNLQNPLAPLFRLVNPSWWENEVRRDRPYPGDVYSELRRERLSRNMGSDNLTYLASNFYAGSDSGPGGGGVTGKFGGSLPMMMSVGDGQGYGASGGQGGALGPGAGRGDSVWIKSMRLPTEDMLRTGLYDKVASVAEAIRTGTGLYGATLQMVPIWPRQRVGIEPQDPSSAHSFRRMMWMGEYGETSGPFGEFFRRFIAPDMQAYDAYNPLPNSMPTWLPDDFLMGDPYMRTPGIGELQLPGDAYERTHPWVAPFKIRASSIGYTEEEIISQWLDQNADMPERLEDIVDFGSRAHLLIQRQLTELGVLVGSEIPIYDKKTNVSGTLDAVVRGESGFEVIDIKTQGGKYFNMGEVPEKYIDQITFYMHKLGLKRGHLAFVNRDDTSQVRIESFDYDEERWAMLEEKLERVRNKMQDLIDSGAVSPYEAYDPLSRLEILAKVAPMSREYRETLKTVAGMPLNDFEWKRYQVAIKQANELTKQYDLYPKRYGIELETQDLTVEGVTDTGEIVTDMGVIKLAGLSFNRDAFADQDAPEKFEKYGVRVGGRIPVTLLRGQFNAEVMNDTTTEAIVGDVNRRAIADGLATEDSSSRSPLASQVIHGDSLLGRIWEWAVHSDNMLTNKFMRVRTGLEQFERGEVYGTDQSRWDHIYGNFIEPTVNSFIAKDPVSAGLQSGIVAALFSRTRAGRIKAFKWGAAAGAGLSVLRGMAELLSGTPWTPRRYRDQAEFDEYWDTLEYLKFTSTAEAAKSRALDEEGINVDALNEGAKREKMHIGPWTALAIDSERRSKRTMFGFDSDRGSLQDAIASLPRRQQQIAEEIILSGSVEEKERFFDLLPDAQKRVLGRFLGQEDSKIPDRVNLTAYFENHFLPGMEWAGWDRGVDLDDLRTRAAQLEGMKVERPTRARLNKARAYTEDISIPKLHGHTPGNIRKAIDRLLANHPNLSADYQLTAADRNQIDIMINVEEDQTSDLSAEVQKHVRR